MFDSPDQARSTAGEMKKKSRIARGDKVQLRKTDTSIPFGHCL